jgi:hypothetical protein
LRLAIRLNDAVLCHVGVDRVDHGVEPGVLVEVAERDRIELAEFEPELASKPPTMCS